jgi:hypothetical protein
MGDHTWDDVRDALSELHALDESENEWIEKAVYDAAVRVSHAIDGFPPAQIFTHGHDSVVFKWGHFYLTITDDRIYGLVSGELRENAQSDRLTSEPP